MAGRHWNKINIQSHFHFENFEIYNQFSSPFKRTLGKRLKHSEPFENTYISVIILTF